VQSFAFFRAEKSFFVSETKLLGTEVKGGLGEVNEETLDPGIEEIRTDGKDQDKNNQVSPMHRHEQHLPERFHCAHELYYRLTTSNANKNPLLSPLPFISSHQERANVFRGALVSVLK
jgi:hypothetical protein